jgi:hypothetical protein
MNQRELDELLGLVNTIVPLFLGDKLNLDEILNEHYAKQNGKGETTRPVPVGKYVTGTLLILSLLAVFALGYYSNSSSKVIYLTQTQPASVIMQTVVSYSTETETSMSLVTQQNFAAQTQPVVPYVNQQPNGISLACGYPFTDPEWCANALGNSPKTTVNGYLSISTGCVLLHGDNQDYALYNVPSNITTGAIQVYGYVYYAWPAGQGFPLDTPFSYSNNICGRVPVWLMPPYFAAW